MYNARLDGAIYSKVFAAEAACVPVGFARDEQSLTSTVRNYENANSRHCTKWRR